MFNKGGQTEAEAGAQSMTEACYPQRTVNIRVRRHGINQFESAQHSLIASIYAPQASECKYSQDQIP